MASKAPIDITVLTAGVTSLSKSFGALLDTEQEYLDYLRSGRKRSFFVTADARETLTVVKPITRVIKKPKKNKDSNIIDQILCFLMGVGLARGAASLARTLLINPYTGLLVAGVGLAGLKGKADEYEKKQEERLLHAEVRNSDRNNLKGEVEDTYTVEDAQKNLDEMKQGPLYMIGQGLSNITGFEPGGVINGATRGVIAETGIPEFVIPFKEIGEIIVNSAYMPVGSLMVGAASGLLDVLPTGKSTASMKIAISKLSNQFGVETVTPAIPGGPGKIESFTDGIGQRGTFFISLMFNSILGTSQGREGASPDDPSGPVVPVNVPAGREGKIKEALNFYLSKGFSNTGAAYMVGNLLQESQLDPAANGDGGRAHGLAQWRDDAASGARWLTYLQWAKDNGKEPGDFYAQLEYTIVEGEKYNAGLTMMKGDNKEDHKKFIRGYEGYSEEGDRFGFAEDILQNWSKYSTSPPPPPEPLKPPPAPKGKTLTEAEYQQALEEEQKLKSPQGKNYGPLVIPNVGSIQHKSNIFGGYQLKYFDPKGVEITPVEWRKRLDKLKPPTQSPDPPSSTGGPGYGQGGPDPTVTISSREDQPDISPIPKMIGELNLPAEKRDVVAMERIEQNTISFVPIIIPGQVIENVSYVPQVSVIRDKSLIDPFGHGVKTRSRKVV